MGCDRSWMLYEAWRTALGFNLGQSAFYDDGGLEEVKRKARSTTPRMPRRGARTLGGVAGGY